MVSLSMQGVCCVSVLLVKDLAMTLDEMIEQLTKLRKLPHVTGQEKVSVHVTNCMSPYSAVEISGAGTGIDWLKGRIMLSPTEQLERYRTEKQKEEARQKAQELLHKISEKNRDNIDPTD